ncbi:hypothetical protein F511_27149 [Dorcoceras hygrometricum]|uniref:Spindle pole body component 110-like n=1 Tax=Dorcoceras hygrometricum TaxID=472368 RepID=A0A2Z7ABG1_9LAMI|nr:hypothetical protein F511_27149 [Dorcoceras hygrometricum]
MATAAEKFHTFTQEDLVNALIEMIYEYKKLSQTFEDVKAENECLKDKSDDASCLQLDESDSLNTELSKLKTENESLRSKSNVLTSENDRLNLVMSSWKKSSISLGKLHEVQKPFNDRTGLSLSSGESSSSDTSTQSYLTDDKLKRMSFVKSSYAEPENSKPSWLKNRLDKDRAKAGSQSSELHQQSWYQSGGSGGVLACCVELRSRTTSLSGAQRGRGVIDGARGCTDNERLLEGFKRRRAYE